MTCRGEAARRASVTLASPRPLDSYRRYPPLARCLSQPCCPSKGRGIFVLTVEKVAVGFGVARGGYEGEESEVEHVAFGPWTGAPSRLIRSGPRIPSGSLKSAQSVTTNGVDHAYLRQLVGYASQVETT
jgi:hypothetical protein